MASQASCSCYTLTIVGLLCAYLAAGARPVDNPQSAERTLTLLVTRHGFSCANLAQSYMEGTHDQLSHTAMKDPYLAGAGWVNSKNAGDRLAKYLEDKKLTVDAVLSSSLLRAMQTAALQYHPGMLYVVPHLSEHGVGDDNKPTLFDKTSQNELIALSKWPGDFPNVKLDLHFALAAPSPDEQEGDWKRFKTFLAKKFLPALGTETTLAKSEIVLAVVTHSNFMKGGEIAEKCKAEFGGEDKKPNNNQVVSLSYPLKLENINGLMADYEIGKMSSNSKCTSPEKGMARTKLQPCQKDIGDICPKEFPKTYLKVAVDPPKTREEIIGKIRDKIKGTYPTKKSKKQLQEELEGNMNTKCMTGGEPEVSKD